MELPLHENDLAEPGSSKRTCSIKTAPTYRSGRAVLLQRVARRIGAEGVLETKYVLRSEIGRNPIYQYLTDEGPVSVIHPGVGAPLAAGFVEEIASLG